MFSFQQQLPQNFQSVYRLVHVHAHYALCSLHVKITPNLILRNHYSFYHKLKKKHLKLNNFPNEILRHFYFISIYYVHEKFIFIGLEKKIFSFCSLINGVDATYMYVHFKSKVLHKNSCKSLLILIATKFIRECMNKLRKMASRISKTY